MAVAVRTRLVGADKLRAILERAAPGSNPRIPAAILRVAAVQTQSISAREKIKRGGRAAPERTRLTSRTGTGRRSIAVNLAPLPHASETGSDLTYMVVHETGGTFGIPSSVVRAHTRTVAFGRTLAPFQVPQHSRAAHSATFPRRPWLEPAVDDVLRKLPDIAVKLWEREI